MPATTATTVNDRTLYRPPLVPVLIDVPELEFAMVDGEGAPEGASYQLAISALYSMSYPVVMALRRQGRSDLHVRPLEGLWWTPDADGFDPDVEARDRWRWTMMIRQPDDVPAEVHDDARVRAAAKLGAEVAGLVRIERFAEGRCAQLLHVGPYSAEGADIRRLHEFVEASGLRRRGRHHEIYLSDPRRCAPERIRTVLRQPVDDA